MKDLEEIYKTENKLYLDRLNNTKIVDLNLIEYLKASIKSHKDKSSGCIGWDYLKTNLTKELKAILYLDKKYSELTYNSENVEFILKYLNIKEITEELKKQLGSFVYVWKDIKSNENEAEKENNLKNELEKEGFKEFNPLVDIEKHKDLDNLKVECCLDINVMSVFGSSDKKEIIKGKFVWSEHNNALMIIPKRCRTKGYIIRKKAYYRGIN